jgi:diamine N-acetyltransferase
MSIRLEPITRENWYECSQLEVKPEQRRFVSSNLLCIAEMQFYPSWGAYAIYDKDQMVGFVLYEHDQEQDEWWISSLMVAAAHQGKGYGRAALQALLPLIRQKGCQEIWVGYANDNSVARALYSGLGFNEVGVDDEDDIVAQLRWPNEGETE